MSASGRPPESTLRRWAMEFTEQLRRHEAEINSLNVYPVPDGDTGSNLRLTMEAVAASLDQLPDPAAAITRGSLMGARGNSGVITSQVLRGICEPLQDGAELTPASLCEGLRRGSDLAYSAVTRPQEGTILTVVREASEEAGPAAAEEGSSAAFTTRVLRRAREALARTPEQLPVLAQAGVVDAGGRGFVLLLESLLFVLDGTPVPEPEAAAGVVSTQPAKAPESMQFPFEVQFLFEAPDEAAERYRQILEGYGDCVLVVGGDGTYNVHVHTDRAGPVIEEALALGRPRQIEVTSLEGQVAELHEASVLARLRGEPEPQDTSPLDPLGVVAVGAGDGILSIFRSMGVKGLVPGGQTFNPSAEEILEGIRRARAEQVIVLPNNRNVIASARTAARVAVDEGVAKRVEVVATESPLQAFTALVALDRDSSIEEAVEAMTTEGLRTRHGEVAFAVRTADTPAGHVEAGQCLGLAGGEVVAIGADPNECVLRVLEKMADDDASLVTLVYGEGIDEWSAHELGKRVGSALSLEVEVHHGGQPHYPYLLGVE
ncbi:MAG TPA: DAK2 domain-containing protein [Actinomycetota bacterium]|nr:DAK2 domain-containing protein [Actinomycetota bacterium]